MPDPQAEAKRRCEAAAEEIFAPGHPHRVDYMAKAIAEHTGLAAVLEENDRLRAACKEIAKAEGAYNREPLEHASNTIDSMVAIAEAALTPAEAKT